ncbi:TetR/AcrR family transcriptional regulator [Promicromonospora iranensis]|uniref:AcrR family transcriptional regulator n=1 Tax=Promicromonospora iranensis TaxID=1105144 RepID=A0ABU2CKR6_9MICO|nr:TetR/AcrR family transcriptional regulator [Promicromonospora iranensis]MDR7381903.1 AcrR family transcriptional regulator [Promicromonospora iranensis]
MVRLTRAEQQERTRRAVLGAAREEFVEHGYALAKIDRIAERAELTRGAVYSNFPGKRALYLAVLVALVQDPEAADPSRPPGSLADALGGFARVWLERLPLADDTASGGRLQLRSLAGVVDDERGRTVLAQLARVEALLLAVGLESCAPERSEPARRVRLAELVLTMLSGSAALAEMAPGFGDPFDRARACEHLAGLDLDDTWAPSYLPHVEPAEPVHDAWTPPAGLADEIAGGAVDLGADGLITVLGAHRLGAVEEAVRTVRPGEQATVVVVASDPAETSNLVRLRVADAVGSLRRVFGPEPWQHVRLVIDDAAVAASAIGLSGVGDDTQAAVLVRDGLITARAQGLGAAYAATTAHHPPPSATSRRPR